MASTPETETSCRRRFRFLPRMLIDVSERDLSTEVLGHRIKLPIGIAPTAMQRMAHPDGECASARAAQVSGPASRGSIILIEPEFRLILISWPVLHFFTSLAYSSQAQAIGLFAHGSQPYNLQHLLRLFHCQMTVCLLEAPCFIRCKHNVNGNHLYQPDTG